jgi:translation initiation factor IF-3
LTVVLKYDIIGYQGAWNAMNKKQEKTLAAIFEEPVRANIDWHDVESLLKSLGAVITQGRGSRVRVSLNGVRAVFHEPHPEQEMQKGAVRSLRGFLMEAGVEIDDQNSLGT